MKFVVAPDLHIWPIVRLRYPAMTGDSFCAADDVFSYAGAHERLLILPGDMMDYGERGGVSACLQYIIPRLRHRYVEKGLKTFYICGSHDSPKFTGFKANPPWLEALEVQHSTHMHKQVLTYGDKTFYGIDGCSRLDFQKEIAEIPDNIDVLVIHQGLQELLGFEAGETKAYDTCCDELVGKAKLVIAGHVHVSKHWEYGGTTFLSPGSGVMKKMSEAPQKYFYDVTLDEKGVHINELPILNKRPFFDMEAMDAAGREEVLKTVTEFILDEKLPEELRMGFLRLRYSPVDGFYNELTEAVDGKFHTELVPISSQCYDNIKLTAEKDRDIDDEIARITSRFINPTEEAGLYDLAVEIQKDSFQRPDVIIDRTIEAILA